MQQILKIIFRNKWLFLILAFAWLVRLWGIQFGLPYQYHPDEVKYVILALKVGVVGPNVGYFDNPTGFVYLLFFEYGLFYLIGRLFSFFHSARDLAILYYQNPSVYLLLGRTTVALLSVGTVYLTYLVSKKSFNRTVGLVAALFLACSFGHIRDSHFAVPDIPMVFFVIFAFYFIIHFWQTKQNKAVFLGAFFTGIAIGFKYTAGFIAVPLLSAYFFQASSPYRKYFLNFILILLLIFVGFFIVCPYAIIDFPKFHASLQFLRSLDKIGYFGIDPNINGFTSYLYMLNWQLGSLILLSGIVGIFYSLYRQKKLGIILFSFPIVYYLSMGRSKLIFDRFMLPVLPFFALASAVLIIEFSRRVKYHNLLVPIVAIFFVLQPVVNVTYYDDLLTKKDTRTLAKEWVEQNIPTGSKIATEGYGPPLMHYRDFLQKWIPQEVVAKEKYAVTELPKQGAATHPVSYYREQGYSYLIISSFIYLRYWVRPDLDQIAIHYYGLLPKDATRVALFTPYKKTADYLLFRRFEIFPATELFTRKQPGPVIQVFKLQ